MTEHALWPWVTLSLLGGFHGINPGMGWLFAVALGMQEGNRRAVWQALLPLGLGHVLAVGAAILPAALAGIVIPVKWLRWPVAGTLLALGVYRLIRQRHPRWVGMRVGMKGLTLWSFLMASAHGAGLMVLPVFLGMAAMSQPNGQSGHLQGVEGPLAGLAATLVHGAAYLLVTAVIALLAFEKFGLGLLRKAWINLDLIWAAALIATGVFTVALL